MNPPKNFNPHPFSYHEEIELRIDTLTNLGLGLGRKDNWVIMVPFALPGELVLVRIYRNFKNYSDADLIRVIEESSHRLKPKCDLFGTCGGCQYQNFEYTEQLKWKQRQIKEIFAKLAGLEVEVKPTIASPKEYYYRSKITPHFPKPGVSNNLPIGFLKNGGYNQVVDVPQCSIATEALNKCLPKEREKIFSGKNKYKKGGTILLRDAREGVITDNNAIVSQEIGDNIFQFIAGDFFQNNPFILPLMIDYVINQARGEKIRYLIDAYCGVGVFAISAAKQFEKVIGIEINESAVKWAQKNAHSNKITNSEFIVGKAEHIFEKIFFPPQETVVIIDPPRKGCDQVFLDQLIAFGPEKIVYVSCEPSTQARDLKLLLDFGYSLIEVQPFDLFPQTRHIENVIVLEKNNNINGN